MRPGRGRRGAPARHRDARRGGRRRQCSAARPAGARCSRRSTRTRAWTSADLLALGERAVPVFEAAGDDRGLMEAWSAIGHANHGLCRFEARDDAFRRAAEYAARCGDERRPRTTTRHISGSATSSGRRRSRRGSPGTRTARLEHSWRVPRSSACRRCSRRCVGGSPSPGRWSPISRRVFEELGPHVSNAHRGEWTSSTSRLRAGELAARGGGAAADRAPSSSRWASAAGSRPRRASSATCSARSGSTTRPRNGRGRARSSARATTSSRRCTGARSRRGCAPTAASSSEAERARAGGGALRRADRHARPCAG